jgi:hypothetical protein
VFAEDVTRVGAAVLPSQPSQYVITSADIDTAKAAVVSEFERISNDNFLNFDLRIAAYLQQQQFKLILGCLGINLLVAGIVYFFIMKQTKDLSYQSIGLKRKKENEDRAFMADNLNEMRAQMNTMQEYMKTQFDQNLLTMKELADYYKQYGGHHDGGGENNWRGGYGNSGTPMEGQNYVPQQPAQEQFSERQQYEQHDSYGQQNQYGEPQYRN